MCTFITSSSTPIVGATKTTSRGGKLVCKNYQCKLSSYNPPKVCTRHTSYLLLPYLEAPLSSRPIELQLITSILSTHWKWESMLLLLLFPVIVELGGHHFPLFASVDYPANKSLQPDPRCVPDIHLMSSFPIQKLYSPPNPLIHTAIDSIHLVNSLGKDRHVAIVALSCRCCSRRPLLPIVCICRLTYRQIPPTSIPNSLHINLIS